MAADDWDEEISTAAQRIAERHESRGAGSGDYDFETFGIAYDRDVVRAVRALLPARTVQRVGPGKLRIE